MPGVWRLRLPLPWPGVPHVNAWAVAAGDGIVLFDTGYADEDGTRQLEFALAQVGFELGDVSLLVCTHSHSDHYGLAGPIVDAAGCDLWMHPAWGHIRAIAEDPDAALERRVEVARQSGVPPAAIERLREARRGTGTGVARLIAPDRELVPGVEVQTDLGSWQVHETPGHAPSHVVLHQPERRLMISGDHLLGRVSLYFDYGHTPDPVAEFAAPGCERRSLPDRFLGRALAFCPRFPRCLATPRVWRTPLPTSVPSTPPNKPRREERLRRRTRSSTQLSTSTGCSWGSTMPRRSLWMAPFTPMIAG